MLGYEKYCDIVNAIGYEAMCEELARAMSDYELSDLCDFIAKNNDIELDYEDEDEE